MRRHNSIPQLILFFVLIVLLVGGFRFFGGARELAIGTEFGWIPIGEFNDRFTSGEWNEDCSLDTCQYSLISKFWNIDYSRSRFGGFEGGERDFKFVEVSGNAQLQDPMYSKKIKFNYEISRVSFGSQNVEIFGFRTDQPGTGTFEIQPGFLNPNEITIIIDGIERGKKIITKDELLNIQVESIQNGFVRIYNIRYRPTSSDRIDNDEVLVFDDFAEGSTFDIDDLEHSVRRFPLSQQAVRRDFSQQSLEQDEKSEVFVKLSRGESVTVPKDQVFRVPYITVFKEGVMQRCKTGEAWNTRTQSCELIISEGVIEDKIGFRIVPIEVGGNEVLYKQKFDTEPLRIGDLSISPSPPTFECCNEIQEDGFILVGEPRDSCWTTNIKGLPVENKERFILAPFITGEYFIGGSGVYKGTRKETNYNCEFLENEDWENNLKVTVDGDALKIVSFDTDTAFGLNSNSKIMVDVNNRINTNFLDAGFDIVYITKILDDRFEVTETTNLLAGRNSYSLNIKTDILGRLEMQIRPWFKIQDKKMYANDKLIFNYEVIESGEKEEDLEDDDEPEEPKVIDKPIEEEKVGFFRRAWRWFKNLFR